MARLNPTNHMDKANCKGLTFHTLATSLMERSMARGLRRQWKVLTSEISKMISDTDRDDLNCHKSRVRVLRQSNCPNIAITMGSGATDSVTVKAKSTTWATQSSLGNFAKTWNMATEFGLSMTAVNTWANSKMTSNMALVLWCRKLECTLVAGLKMSEKALAASRLPMEQFTRVFLWTEWLMVRE